MFLVGENLPDPLDVDPALLDRGSAVCAVNANFEARQNEEESPSITPVSMPGTRSRNFEGSEAAHPHRRPAATSLGNPTESAAGKQRQTNKNAAFPKEGGVCLIMTRKEELLCPWQAWQRPTLPGLKP